MAGDWIKIEHTTPDKPEVVRMATALRIDQDAVTGKLLRLWAWADQNSIDGADVMVTTSFIDRITGRRGFAQALIEVGWLREEEGRLHLPNFDRHNGQTAKARAESARRMTKTRIRKQHVLRESCGNVAEKAQRNAQPEKRREEKSNIATHTARESGWPELKEVVAHGTLVMAPPECCEKFWNEMEGCGWVNRHGQPVNDWRPLLRNYATNWKANEHREKQRPGQPQTRALDLGYRGKGRPVEISPDSPVL